MTEPISSIRKPTVGSNTGRPSTEEVIRELQRNFYQRRLLLVALHLLVPGFILTGVKFATLNRAVPGLEFLWTHSLAFAAIGVILGSLLVAMSMTRCHFGILVNGALVNWRIYGERVDCKLNWFGLSAGFYLLSICSMSFGLAIAIYCLIEAAIPLKFQTAIIPLICMGLAVVGLSVWRFEKTHAQGYAIASRLLRSECESRRPDQHLRSKHRMNSIDDTNEDIGVVVVTAVALFTTMVAVLPDLADVNTHYIGERLAGAVFNHGMPVTISYALLVLILSQSMLIRLRIAMAEHVSELNKYRQGEELRVWSSTLQERTSILYLFLSVLFSLFAMALYARWFDSGLLTWLFLPAYVAYSRIYYRFVITREGNRFIKKYRNGAEDIDTIDNP